MTELTKHEICRQILDKLSLVIDYDGEASMQVVPEPMDGETFGDWASRALGPNAVNIRLYIPSEVASSETISSLARRTNASHLRELLTLKVSPRQSGSRDNTFVIAESHKPLVLEALHSIECMEMRESSHGIEKYKGMTIKAAALDQSHSFSNFSNPAHVILDVVLSANRKYETHVKKRMQFVKEMYPGLTLSQLNDDLINLTFAKFRDKYDWPNDEERHGRLKLLVANFLHAARNSSMSELDFCKSWAKTAQVETFRSDPITGGIEGVALATFQHLRLGFGVDTAKPDVWVRYVLETKFGFLFPGRHRLSQEAAIAAAEAIAKLIGPGVAPKPVAYIDQLFVKYGSGYLQGKRRGI